MVTRPAHSGVPAADYVARQGTVSLGQLFQAARRRWLRLGAVMLGSIVGLVALSFAVGHRYEAQVVAVPRGNHDRSSLLNSLSGQIGGLAALTGLGMGDTGERAEALETLQSDALAREFIKKNDLLPVFFRGDWSEAERRWIGRPRTLNEGVKFFNNIRRVIEDRRTGLVTVRFQWRDPNQAAAWANSLVASANERMRKRAVARAEISIAYLKREADKAEAVEIRQALYRLMEEGYKNLLLANSSDEYSFAVVDPAIAPDPAQNVSPSRPLYALTGLFLGLIIAGVMTLNEALRPAR